MRRHQRLRTKRMMHRVRGPEPVHQPPPPRLPLSVARGPQHHRHPLSRLQRHRPAAAPPPPGSHPPAPNARPARPGPAHTSRPHPSRGSSRPSVVAPGCRRQAAWRRCRTAGLTRTAFAPTAWARASAPESPNRAGADSCETTPVTFGAAHQQGDGAPIRHGRRRTRRPAARRCAGSRRSTRPAASARHAAQTAATTCPCPVPCGDKQP